MQKTKRNPAPEPETITPAAAPQPKPEPAPSQALPTPDPLRTCLSGLSPEQRETLRVRFLAMILKAIAEMDIHSLQSVAQLTDMVENEQGCSTPAENLVHGLVATHYLYGGITPETVARELDPENTDGFRLNFDEAVDVTRRFSATYPELINGRQGEPKPDPISHTAA